MNRHESNLFVNAKVFFYLFFMVGILFLLVGFNAVAEMNPQLDASQFISLSCKSPELEVGDYCVDARGKAAVVMGNPSKMVIRTLTKREASLFLTKYANTDGVYAAPDGAGDTRLMADQKKKTETQRVPASVKPAQKK
jgi:hypothetical protein